MTKIIEWAKKYCKENGKQFIRMDTWGENTKLIEYYKKCGFELEGTLKKFTHLKSENRVIRKRNLLLIWVLNRNFYNGNLRPLLLMHPNVN